MIRSVHEVEHNGKTVRLLRVYNPHGETEWTGDWSDKSKKWTADLKKKFCFENTNDGAFYIDFDSYLTHFSSSEICMDFHEHPLPKQEVIIK